MWSLPKDETWAMCNVQRCQFILALEVLIDVVITVLLQWEKWFSFKDRWSWRCPLQMANVHDCLSMQQSFYTIVKTILNMESSLLPDSFFDSKLYKHWCVLTFSCRWWDRSLHLLLPLSCCQIEYTMNILTAPHCLMFRLRIPRSLCWM